MVLRLTRKKPLMNCFNMPSDNNSTANGLFSKSISTFYEIDGSNNVSSSQLLNVVNSWNNEKSAHVKIVY